MNGPLRFGEKKREKYECMLNSERILQTKALERLVGWI